MAAQIEGEHVRPAWRVSVGLYAKEIITQGQAGGVSIEMHIPVRAHRKSSQGSNGLRRGSLYLANE